MTGLERAGLGGHNAFLTHTQVSEGRLRHLVRADDLAAIADQAGRDRLRRLPYERPAVRRQGPFELLGRGVAIDSVAIGHHRPNEKEAVGATRSI